MSVLLTAALVLGGVARAAALDWERTSVVAKPRPGADAVLTTFKFTNHGRSTVHILAIETSCGCTDAVPSATEIAPGASGTIEVLFTIGNRTGHQEREVSVATDEAKTPAKLTMIVDLPGGEKRPTSRPSTPEVTAARRP